MNCGPTCSGCSLEHTPGSVFIPQDGTGSNRVLIVGDSGWDYEARTKREGVAYCGDHFHILDNVGTPFSGPSGWWMQRQFDRIGVRREDFLIANSVWCKAPRLGMTDAPHKYPEIAAAIEKCRPNLDLLIAKNTPKVIVTLGGAALHRVTGFHSVDKHHAYTIPSLYHIPTIPLYHPSFILQGNQKYSGAWAFGIQKALRIARGDEPAKRHYDLLMDPAISDAITYLGGEAFGPCTSFYNDWLVCDIETVESPDMDEDETLDTTWTITRISFSNRAGTGISMPFRAPYLDVIKMVLAGARNLVFWNQAFDVPRLRAAGCKLNGVIWDAMWAWHFLQSDLPKKLGFVAPLFLNIPPWKHLSSTMPAYYSALDSAITWDLFWAIKADLETEGRWNQFVIQCTNMIPILEGATNAGIVIDITAQNALLADYVLDDGTVVKGDLVVERDRLFEKIQEKIPVAVRPTKEFKKGKPKKMYPGEMFIPSPEHMGGKGGTLIKAFNPSSPTQKKELFRHLGIKIPFNKKKDAETIESKHLRKYSKKFPVLKDMMDYGERQKVITSYYWELEADGKIHAEFAWNPTTWRKNARNPNIQTIPKRSDLAKKFREMFVASPGHTFIECDSSAIEAVLVGVFAGSSRYVALAKRGVHKWLAEKLAGRPVSKEEPLYDKVKRIVHLSNYMGTPERIAEEYPDDFKTVAEARKLQDFYFATEEGQDLRKWHASVLAAANGPGHYLQTPFGVRHYFFDVLNRRDGKLVMGTDAKRSIAFLPQSTASSLQSLYLSRLPEEYRTYLLNGLYYIPSLRAIIHDSIVLEVPTPVAETAARDLYTAMTGFVEEIGESVGAECKIGQDLGHMTLLKIAA